MTRPRTSHGPAECAVLNAHGVADTFGKGETWFRNHQKELEAEGFPPYDELLDGWNRYRVIAWFEDRIEPTPANDDDVTDRLEAMRNGNI